MGKEYQIERGGAFFIFPGELVSYQADPEEPWEYVWLGFKGAQMDQYLSQLGISSHRPVTQQTFQPRTAAYFRRIRRAFQQSNPICDLQAGGWTRLILAALLADQATIAEREPEPATEIKRQIEQAIRWLTLQYSQPVSIEQMAQTLGYHRTHLSKMFKQHTGMSPMHFLLQIRMERAKLLLAEPLTIEQIAASVGFADALYFSKQFKKWFGHSPTEYRQERLGINRYDCTNP
jgi:AraC-like DNA-binding protein